VRLRVQGHRPDVLFAHTQGPGEAQLDCHGLLLQADQVDAASRK
jgi:hypothetical protein